MLEVESADDLPARPNGMLFCRFGVIILLYYPIPFSPSFLHSEIDIFPFLHLSFFSYTLLIFSNLMLTHHPSDPHRLGHGPFHCCCLLKESLPHPRRSKLPKYISSAVDCRLSI